jgi:hypothetical protein
MTKPIKLTPHQERPLRASDKEERERRQGDKGGSLPAGWSSMGPGKRRKSAHKHGHGD